MSRVPPRTTIVASGQVLGSLGLHAARTSPSSDLRRPGSVSYAQSPPSQRCWRSPAVSLARAGAHPVIRRSSPVSARTRELEGIFRDDSLADLEDLAVHRGSASGDSR